MPRDLAKRNRMIRQFGDLKLPDSGLLPSECPFLGAFRRGAQPGAGFLPGRRALEQFAALPFGCFDIGQTEGRFRVFQPGEDLPDRRRRIRPRGRRFGRGPLPRVGKGLFFGKGKANGAFAAGSAAFEVPPQHLEPGGEFLRHRSGRDHGLRLRKQGRARARTGRIGFGEALEQPPRAFSRNCTRSG